MGVTAPKKGGGLHTPSTHAHTNSDGRRWLIKPRAEQQFLQTCPGISAYDRMFLASREGWGEGGRTQARRADPWPGTPG